MSIQQKIKRGNKMKRYVIAMFMTFLSLSVLTACETENQPAPPNSSYSASPASQGYDPHSAKQ